MLEIPYDQIQWKNADKKIVFKIPLPYSSIKKLTQTKTLGINMNFARAYGFYYAEVDLSENDRKSIHLAYKNCI